MARSPKSANTPTTTHTHTPIAPRTSARSQSRRQPPSSAASTPTVHTPTPLASAEAGPSRLPSLAPYPAQAHTSAQQSKAYVEPKNHALRSVQGEKERCPCPFPDKWGGKDKCGVVEEDAADEVLMAICAALAHIGNRALSPDEIASVCYAEAWLRPPSAAIEPSTLINNAIRTHQKRCEKAVPPRTALLSKHQLAGSVNESVLEAALHPQAFEGGLRPKGTVWYLSGSCKARWRNPFEGIEVPKAPPRKATSGTSKKDSLGSTKAKHGGDKKKSTKGGSGGSVKASSAGPVKIRLVLGGAAQMEDGDDASETGSSSRGSRSTSRARSSATPCLPALASSMPAARLKARSRRDSSMLDDSSSDSSTDDDSDMDLDDLSRPHPANTRKAPVKSRKPPPPPLSLPSFPILNTLSTSSLASPFRELFLSMAPASYIGPPTPTLSSSGYLPPAHSQHPLHPGQAPHASPFPSHSLDNTIWADRHEQNFETSSSSSDEEVRDPDWGTNSGILIRGQGGEGMDGDDYTPMWTAEDEESKVKEATDALRVLFPLRATPEDEVDVEPKIELNRLDNAPPPSDTSSLAESSSTVQQSIGARGKLKSADCPLSAWAATSSPIPSPNFRDRYVNLPPQAESSPTHHFGGSRLRDSFDPDESAELSMDIDDSGEAGWLDESGELPVKAEDSLSDIELGSTIGDAAGTPEHDRQMHTAAWAREAAASSLGFRIKQEMGIAEDDYPSPVTTEMLEEEGEDVSRESRASSAETPSSRSSELPLSETGCLVGLDVGEEGEGEGEALVVMGPESISVEEIDGWLIGGDGALAKAKTPLKRGGRSKVRNGETRCSGNWGSIGVGMMKTEIASPTTTTRASNADTNSPVMRRASLRSRRRRSSTRVPQRQEPPVVQIKVDSPEEMAQDEEPFDEAFGTADLEAARAEADRREKEHRREVRERAEQQKALLEAYRQRVTESSGATPGLAWEGASGDWGSSESLNLQTPTPNGALVSPSALFAGAAGMGMDPKALLSPPLFGPGGGSGGGGMGIAMLDEVMSLQEVEAVMSSVSASSTPAVLPSPPLLPPAPASAPATTSKTSSKPIAIAPAPPSSPLTPETTTATTTAQATPIPINPSDKDGKQAATAMVELPTAVPPPPPPAAKSTSPPAARTQSTITKPLCAGVDACVVDNIPVYAHIAESRQGVGSKLVVLRRLDTDFVNGTSLLSALGVPPAKHPEYLSSQTPYLASHRTVPHQDTDGVQHSVGVAGVWVQLVEARDWAKQLNLAEASLLGNILREDLFQLFARMAGIKPDHSAAESFGLPFVAKAPLRPSQPVASSSSSSTLSVSSTNSKSTPNLTALSTSAPASAHLRAATAPGAKNPALVRSAPPTPPDGAPMPKRRRATIVGGLSPLIAKSPQVAAGGGGGGGVQKKVGGGAGGGTAGAGAASRKTRASVGGGGGEAARPRVQKA